MRTALALVLLATACTQSTPPKPTAKAEPPPSARPIASAMADAAVEAPRVATIPELTFEPFRVDDKPLKHVFAIEGATIVTTDNVVGYIDGDRVEWIAKVPKERPHIGRNLIEHVDGKYLDRIDVVMVTDNGRAIAPIWLPLTGKGTLHDEAAGGGYGSIVEARVGESVLIATHSSFNNDRITTVRGPNLTRKFTSAKGCKGYYAQPYIQSSIDQYALVAPTGFAGTAAGTLVAVGDRCGEDAPWAEVWPPSSTTSRLVDLTAHWRRVGYRMQILRSGEDGLWLFNGPFQRLLQFQNGEFNVVPIPDAPIHNVFVSSKGQLHAQTTDEVFRLEPSGKWQPVARFANPPADRVTDFVMDDSGRFWAANRSEAYRLRETKQVPIERTCPGWFVFLSDKEGASFAKLLADYPKHEGLKLSVSKSYPWVTGVPFATKADADAFAAYATTAAPKEKIGTFCYTPSPS